MVNLGKAVRILGQEVYKGFREDRKAIHEYNRIYKLFYGTRVDRRIRRKLQRWFTLGSEIFLCDPMHMYRLWKAVRDSPLTMEEIAEHAEHLGELAKMETEEDKEKEGRNE